MISPRDELSVEVNGVTVSYPNGNVALVDASFQLHGGSICALVGVNGSGKSTLFKAIMGLLDELLTSFVKQRRMKLAGEYKPCYRLVA